MKPGSIAVVGAAETTRMGVVPEMSQLGLNLDCALNALADAGLKPSDIDGVATAGEHPWNVSAMLGITPKWLDGTSVGGCSYMLHVRHACAAIAAGLCTTVLVTHGESGRSQVGPTRWAPNPREYAGPVRGAVRHRRARHPVHRAGAALPQGDRHDAGGSGPRRGDPARMGRQEPEGDA